MHRLRTLEGLTPHRRIYLAIYVFAASFTVLNVLGSLSRGVPDILLWAFTWAGRALGLQFGSETLTLTHLGLSLAVLVTLAYTLYRVKLSSSIALLTVVYIYTTAGARGVEGPPLYMYLLNVSLLMMVLPYGRSIRLGVSIGDTGILYRLLSILEDYVFPVAVAGGFAVVSLTVVGVLHVFVTSYMPEPYRSVFGPVFSTRLGLLAFTLVAFLVFVWALRELLDLPVLYLSMRRADAIAECRVQMLEEAERLTGEPRAVVSAVSAVAGLLISYTLWFLVYDWVVEALAFSRAPEPLIWLLATLTMILVSLLVNSAVKRRLLAGLKDPGPPRFGRVALPLMVIVAYTAALMIAFHVDAWKLLLTASGMEGGVAEDPLSLMLEQLNSFFGIDLNERVRRLESIIGFLMRLLWR